jgi:hypothetical protein
MERKLPIYKIQIAESDELGVDYVALVDKPAIERSWMAFEKQRQLFQANEDKQIVSGALIVANLPIYRRDEKLGEFYVVFDSETTMDIVQRFFKKGFSGNVNLMHDPKQVVQDVFMFESFIINKERGICTPKGHDELPDGSWFGSFKVNNPEVWKQIKDGTFQGFSVEGLFNHDHIGDKDEAVIAEIQDVIQNVSQA